MWKEQVQLNRSTLLAGLLMAACATSGLAQKVKVGYDKSVDFSKYKTYTWAQPAMPPTRPLLYETVVSSIDHELTLKGLQRTDKNGDLELIPAGGIGFGTNVSTGTPMSSTHTGPPPTTNATMWTGAEGGGALLPAVPDATLLLEFVDRSANQIVWSGAVTQKLDIERKTKSLDLAVKAIAKLLKQFPPKRS